MNKICKQYISDVKHLLPIKGKEEKNYIKRLQKNIEEFCEDNNIENIEELYFEFGSPGTLITDYFDTLDVEDFIKKVKVSKYIKIALASIVSILIVGLSIFNILSYQRLQNLLDAEVVYIEEKLVVERGK